MIKFISEDALLEIKNNHTLLYDNVVSSKKQTLEEAFQNDMIIRDTSVHADEFQLDMSAEKPELTDLENVKRVYKNMSMLSESQASDERIWAAYTLSVFADYECKPPQPRSQQAADPAGRRPSAAGGCHHCADGADLLDRLHRAPAVLSAQSPQAQPDHHLLAGDGQSGGQQAGNP